MARGKNRQVKTGKSKPQEEQKHPVPSSEDPTRRMDGQNVGTTHAADDRRESSAADVQAIVDRFAEMGRAELAQVPVVAIGSRLKQGAVYLDLRSPTSVPFTATAEMVADEVHYYAPKAEVPYAIWNRLVKTLAPGPVGAADDIEKGENAPPFSPQRAVQEAAVEQTRPGRSQTSSDADRRIDEAAKESFPASDPPSWTTGGSTGEVANPSQGRLDELDKLSDQQLRDKARQLNLDTSALSREQVITALRANMP